MINVMKRYSQFNDAEARAKMTSMHADDINNILTQFVTELMKFLSRKGLYVARGIDLPQ